MTPAEIFLLGVISAWAFAHAGLGIFFLLAHMLGRKETEYLLFGLLCLALSVTSVGVGLSYLSDDVAWARLADQVTHTGAILAAGLNTHFALCFADIRRRRFLVRGLYGTVVVYEALNLSGLWWQPELYHLVRVDFLGFELQSQAAIPSAIGLSFYVLTGTEILASTLLFLYAFHKGRKEAVSLLLGSFVLLPAVLNDVAQALGIVRNTTTLVPHSFLLYALGAAGTLLLRYRISAIELENTASSLRQRTDELHRSNAELRQVQKELTTKQQLAAIGELAAAIAHEVRNPLAVIVNAVSGLRRPAVGEEDRSLLLNIIDEEAGRLNRLVTDLLRFARPVKVRRAPVALAELANRSRTAAMRKHQVVVHLDESPSIQTVWLDPGLFRLVFDNLIENACQSMGEEGSIEVHLRPDKLDEQLAVRVEIRDHGKGMSHEVKLRALDPFFTTRPSGTGLGLPIVQRIVEAHGGKLSIESVEGQGTTVALFIPVGDNGVDSPPSSEFSVERVLQRNV